MFTPRSIQDLDSSYDVLSYILLQISPYTKSPYFIRRVCKGWKNLYDTGGMWMMIYKCYFAQSIPRGITHRRACSMEFQKPYEKIMSPRALELFYTSGYKKLLCIGHFTSLPVGDYVHSFCLICLISPNRYSSKASESCQPLWT